MSEKDWQRWAARAARAVERRVDDARSRLRPRRARHIIPYHGFGSRHEVFLTGRVLADPPVRPSGANDAWWRNLAATLRHLESDEVPGARVHLRFAGAAHDAVTDEEGYYRAWLRPSQPLTDLLWHDVSIEVLHPLHSESASVHATGRVLVPPGTARIGVISDLDDTVIRTDATRLFTMLKRTLLENARSRLPFPGVSAFYSALHAGTSGTAANPVFYVSSSPWNLYPLLTEFLELQSIPAGPLMLRDWGIDASGVLPTAHGTHKLAAIRQIMNCYPALPFVLIGDSGQEDPEIYRDVVHEYRGRILAVYIRNVTTDPARARAVGELGEEVRAAGSELRLSNDTLTAAVHAGEQGWIDGDAVDRVRSAVNSSGASPG
jgi:phosphatidate phosphatase APP1